MRFFVYFSALFAAVLGPATSLAIDWSSVFVAERTRSLYSHIPAFMLMAIPIVYAAIDTAIRGNAALVANCVRGGLGTQPTFGCVGPSHPEG